MFRFGNPVCRKLRTVWKRSVVRRLRRSYGPEDTTKIGIAAICLREEEPSRLTWFSHLYRALSEISSYVTLQEKKRILSSIGIPVFLTQPRITLGDRQLDQ